jgi:hypothetical protein
MQHAAEPSADELREAVSANGALELDGMIVSVDVEVDTVARPSVSSHMLVTRIVGQVDLRVRREWNRSRLATAPVQGWDCWPSIPFDPVTTIPSTGRSRNGPKVPLFSRSLVP